MNPICEFYNNLNLMTFFGNNFFTQEQYEQLKASNFNEKNIIELFS